MARVGRDSTDGWKWSAKVLANLPGAVANDGSSEAEREGVDVYAREVDWSSSTQHRSVVESFEVRFLMRARAETGEQGGETVQPEHVDERRRALLCSALQCSAVLCSALPFAPPCPAVLCRALPRCQ